MSKLLLLLFLLFSFSVLVDELKIIIWNIEILGVYEGRGFVGGFGWGNFFFCFDE